ncbi:hypothetical protein [Celeribacter marinus]|uniref:hypothetical protein n=1 Tax=Celeribacter marinus TaxID=1397108 RepID=UPI00316D4F9F
MILPYQPPAHAMTVVTGVGDAIYAIESRPDVFAEMGAERIGMWHPQPSHYWRLDDNSGTWIPVHDLTLCRLIQNAMPPERKMKPGLVEPGCRITAPEAPLVSPAVHHAFWGVLADMQMDGRAVVTAENEITLVNALRLDVAWPLDAVRNPNQITQHDMGHSQRALQILKRTLGKYGLTII